MSSTEAFSDQIAGACRFVADKLADAQAILIGLGAGMSAAAGHTYTGKRFLDNFGDFAEKYGIPDMYTGGFYPFPTPEEYWAWWSRQIDLNRYKEGPGAPYADLAAILKGRNYFIISTNVDHLVQKAGMEKDRLFYTQGDFGLFQCSVPCHQETYDNEEQIKTMRAAEKDMQIPTELLPKCPRCGEPMVPNLRTDDTFVQDAGWYRADARYEKFVKENRESRIVYLEIGVGGNTPGIIKYTFWRLTLANPKAFYICINQDDARFPQKIAERAIGLQGDAAPLLAAIRADLGNKEGER